jgi:cell division protein FtsB
MEGSNCACRFNDDDEPVNECRVHADQRREIDRLRGERDALKAENERLLEEVAQLCGYDNYAEMAALAGGRSE